MQLPSGIDWLVHRLVPPEFAEDLLDDLGDGYARRGRAWEANVWLVGELIRTPWAGLWRQARRLRAGGMRGPVHGGRGGEMVGFGMGLRVAARALRRRPAFTTVALLTLALSIGSATAIFSVLEGVVLRPLPYADADRLVRVFGTNTEWREAEQEILRNSWDHLDLSEDVLDLLRDGVRGLESAGGSVNRTLRIDDGGDPTRATGAWVTGRFFETLGADPLVGRLPSAEEVAAGDRLLVLSERLWASRYGRDDGVLGRVVSLDGDPFTIVGVLARSFSLPSELTTWWAPLDPDFAGGRTDVATIAIVARLQPDVDRALASAAVTAAIGRLGEAQPSYAALGARLEPLRDAVVGPVKDGLTLLFLAAAVVVLIASVNLANLVVARGARRRSELSMRAALGAGRGALVWDVLAEIVLLCVVGGVAGLVLATQGVAPLLGLLERATPGFPRADNVGINLAVLAFSSAVAVVTALLAGVVPALAASRRAPWEALQGGRQSRGGAATRRTQHMLLLVEAGLAVVLLAGAGLLLRSAANVASIDPGYDAASIAYLTVEPPPGRYGTATELAALASDLEIGLSRLPRSIAVGNASSLPGLGGASGSLVWTPGAPEEARSLAWSADVSPGYFDAMGIPLVSGRAFRRSDSRDARVVVVSELFAERWLPGRNPVGETIMVGTGTQLSGGRVVASGGDEWTVIGVVGDVRQLTLTMEPDAMMYQPHRSGDGSAPARVHLIVRTSGPPAEVVEAARAEVMRHDGSLLIVEHDVLRNASRRLLAGQEVRMVLILALAGMAAFLTVAGIYGVVAYVVSDRTHEIGVRMALGARAGAESARMVRQALRPVVAGVTVGLVGAFLASRLLEDALFGVERLDLPTYAAAFVGMVGVAALAAWIPASRAAAVDPVRVLTEE